MPGQIAVVGARLARGLGLAATRQALAPLGAATRALHGTPLLRDASLEAKLEEINEKFAEARDEIEYANEDAETTYFDESASQARKVAAETRALYDELLNSLDDGNRAKVRRSMALKMEQLRAEVELLDKIHQ